jgi:tripartite-type tricarboxylate transporter receptor subunit TctC
MFGNLPEVLPHVQSGRLRAIALTGNARHTLLPDVPTFAEAGFGDIQAQSWFAMFAPSGVPAPIVDKLSNKIAEAVATEAVREKLIGIGANPIGNRHAQFQPFVESEVARWGELVRASGATAD